MATIVPGIIGCFACSGTDHFESACPELRLEPAKTYAEHMARIDKYVEWCHENDPEPGRMTPHQKQELIKQENARWAKAQKARKAS